MIGLRKISKDIQKHTQSHDDETLYADAFYWFWYNEATRHHEDIDAVTDDINKTREICEDQNRDWKERAIAKAMCEFLENEVLRHKIEYQKIHLMLKKYESEKRISLVQQIPPQRVEVD